MRILPDCEIAVRGDQLKSFLKTVKPQQYVLISHENTP